MKFTDPPAKAFEADNSSGATAERDQQGRFLAGRKGGPGRRRGSRQILAEQAFHDTYEAWQQHGAIVLERVACLDPGKFLDFVAKMLPRELKIEHRTPTDGMTDDQLERMLAIAERLAAGPVIDGQMRNVTPTLPPLAVAPATEAAQRAEQQRRGLNDQHDALDAVAPVMPASTLPHPVGRAVPLADRDVERRNVAKLEDEINPEDLF